MRLSDKIKNQLESNKKNTSIYLHKLLSTSPISYLDQNDKVKKNPLSDFKTPNKLPTSTYKESCTHIKATSHKYNSHESDLSKAEEKNVIVTKLDIDTQDPLFQSYSSREKSYIISEQIDSSRKTNNKTESSVDKYSEKNYLNEKISKLESLNQMLTSKIKMLEKNGSILPVNLNLGIVDYNQFNSVIQKCCELEAEVEKLKSENQNLKKELQLFKNSSTNDSKIDNNIKRPLSLMERKYSNPPQTDKSKQKPNVLGNNNIKILPKLLIEKIDCHKIICMREKISPRPINTIPLDKLTDRTTQRSYSKNDLKNTNSSQTNAAQKKLKNQIKLPNSSLNNAKKSLVQETLNSSNETVIKIDACLTRKTLPDDPSDSIPKAHDYSFEIYKNMKRGIVKPSFISNDARNVYDFWSPRCAYNSSGFSDPLSNKFRSSEIFATDDKLNSEKRDLRRYSEAEQNKFKQSFNDVIKIQRHAGLQSKYQKGGKKKVLTSNKLSNKNLKYMEK